MRLTYSCKFPNCKNGYYKDVPPDSSYTNKHFYRFPRKNRLNLLKKWKEVCNIKDDVFCDNFYVCQDHFTSKDFVNPEERFRINCFVIPKAIVREGDENTILSDHSYFKLGCESQASSNSEGDTESVNAVNLNTQPDGCTYSADDELFCDSYAQLEMNKLDFIIKSGTVPYESSQNVTEDTQITTTSSNLENINFNLLAVDPYEFLLSPFEPENVVIKQNDGTLNAASNNVDVDPSSMVKLKKTQVHANITDKLVKLSKLLADKTDYMNILLTLCKKGTFNVIQENIGLLSHSFVASRFRNHNKAVSKGNWSTEDKTIALFLYKTGSRFYQYLLMHFDLPSIRLLEILFSNIPFDTGLDPLVLATLKSEVSKLNPLDKYCGLVFDEMPLSQGFYYARNKQVICGYQDVGHLGRSHLVAKYALVFMICGLRKPWKQVVAYYFVGHTIPSDNFKLLIIEIISQLQNIGINIAATICDHNSIYQAILKELCKENSEEPSPFYFSVNERPVVIIFNVPRLLQDTRNAFVGHNIKLEANFVAKFEHIEKLFNMDSDKKFKTLPNLKKEHLMIKNVNVNIAASQLSNTVAAGIETLVLTHVLPPEAMCTAEFVSTMDNLYNSLSSHDTNLEEGKEYRCSLMDKSPHIEFWSQLLGQLNNWKVINSQTETDKTNSFNFIEGWQTTIRSVMFLWNDLKKVGFTNLGFKLFNERPLKLLFYYIMQYNSRYKLNTTCFQFVETLKTYIISNYMQTCKNVSGNQNNASFFLCNLLPVWIQSIENIDNECFTVLPEHNALNRRDIDAKFIIDHILNSIDFNETCHACKNTLFSPPTADESDDSTNDDTTYVVSQTLIAYLNIISDKLYKCLERHSYMNFLEKRFKKVFNQTSLVTFCDEHFIEISILNKVVPLLINKYVQENNKTLRIIYEKHGSLL